MPVVLKIQTLDIFWGQKKPCKRNQDKKKKDFQLKDHTQRDTNEKKEKKNRTEYKQAFLGIDLDRIPADQKKTVNRTWPGQKRSGI